MIKSKLFIITALIVITILIGLSFIQCNTNLSGLYETSYGNIKSHHGEISKGFDKKATTGFLINTIDGGCIQLQFQMDVQLMGIEIPTDSERPPSQIIIQVNNQRTCIERKSLLNSTASFPFEAKINASDCLKLFFSRTDSPGDSWTCVNEIYLIGKFPIYSLSYIKYKRLLHHLLKQPYKFWIITSLIYFSVGFSFLRVKAVSPFRRNITELFASILYSASFLWYSFAIVFFFAFVYFIYSDTQPDPVPTMWYIFGTRVEIQLSFLLLFISILTQVLLGLRLIQRFNFFPSREGRFAYPVLFAKHVCFLCITYIYCVIIIFSHFFIYINLDRYIPIEMSRIRSEKEIRRFETKENIATLFDGDDGTYTKLSKIELNLNDYKGNIRLGSFLGVQKPKWLWVAYAFHDFKWDEGISVIVNDNKKLIAKRDFSAAYLRFDLPKDTNKLTIFSTNSCTPEISELYLAGTYLIKLFLFYISMIGISVLITYYWRGYKI